MRLELSLLSIYILTVGGNGLKIIELESFLASEVHKLSG